MPSNVDIEIELYGLIYRLSKYGIKIKKTIDKPKTQKGYESKYISKNFIYQNIFETIMQNVYNTLVYNYNCNPTTIEMYAYIVLVNEKYKKIIQEKRYEYFYINSDISIEEHEYFESKFNNENIISFPIIGTYNMCQELLINDIIEFAIKCK